MGGRGWIGGQKILFEPCELVAVYKLFIVHHCYIILYAVAMGMIIFTIWSCHSFKNKWQKKKSFSVFNVLGYN